MVKTRASFALFAVLTFLLCATNLSHAQSFNVLYAFGAGGDGAQPLSGVTLDQTGRIYGTTCIAGHGNGGTVYQLRNHWLLTALHEFFPNNGDGGCPMGRPVFGPDGRLYGTTEIGGIGGYWGVIYRLGPPAHFCGSAQCYWDEAVLFSFTGGADGGKPFYVDPVFDAAGNMYGTTWQGGVAGNGVAFKLARSGNTWTESVLHAFAPAEGVEPASSVMFDQAGNIWGTTAYAGGQNDQGTVFELTPSGSGWTANILHVFQGPPNDGNAPEAGLVSDGAGGFFGTTAYGGPNYGGTAFALSRSGSSWNYSLIYTGFTGGGLIGSLVRDSAGNLYGTSNSGGDSGKGTVYKLSPSNGQWVYTSLHDFSGGDDGANPVGGVTFDPSGNIYGTASAGGRYGRGVVWEITP